MKSLKWPSFIMFLLIYLIARDFLFIFNGYVWLFFDGLIFFIMFFSYRPIRQFTLRAFDYSVMFIPRTYGFIGGALFLFFVTQSLFIGQLGVDDGSDQSAELGIDQVIQSPDQNGLQILFLFVSIAILTPIKEEVLYRGILHRFLEHRYHFWVGLIVSSLIFGLLHIGFPYSAITMGIIFVFLYRLTNSLIPPIILHIIWNSFASIAHLMA